MITKDQYLDIGTKVAKAYLQEEQDPNAVLAKMASDADWNADEVQNACAHTNHIIHSSLMNSKQASEDQYIEFEIARPEKVAESVDGLNERPSPVYKNGSIFLKKAARTDSSDRSVEGFRRSQLRRTEILKQNIKNISSAHTKMANELQMVGQNAEDKVNKLYDIVQREVQLGKDPEVIKDAVRKSFDTEGDFNLIWKVVESRLIANGIMDRPIHDEDRPQNLDIQDLPANPTSPIVSTASAINKDLHRIDQMESQMEALEKMASEAQDDLYRAMLTEKQAVMGAVGKGLLKGTGAVLKTLGKGTAATAKGVGKGVGSTAKAVKKHPGPSGAVGFGMLDVVPGFNYKAPTVTSKTLQQGIQRPKGLPKFPRLGGQG